MLLTLHVDYGGVRVFSDNVPRRLWYYLQ